MKTIPSKYQVGGTTIEVKMVERCENNNAGCSLLTSGYIEIADKFNKCDVQSEDSKRNTFFHELTHTILAHMGYHELSEDEKFVSSFSGFLTESMKNAMFMED